MNTLNFSQMEELSGGDSNVKALGFTCGYATGVAIVVAGFLTGGLAWFVGGMIAGPTCIAAIAYTASN